MPAKTDHPSEISLEDVRQLLLTHYAVETADIKRLAGEVDLNFFARDRNGNSYTVKFSDEQTGRNAIEFQAAIMMHLSKQSLPFAIPGLVPGKDGSDVFDCQLGEHLYLLRVQSWVNGRMLGDLPYRSPELLNSWGATAGQLVKALQDFDHPVAHRSYQWNPSETLLSQQYLSSFATDEQRMIATHFWAIFASETLPLLAGLRKGVNYNDAHEHNLLIGGAAFAEQVVGVIDFGDALYTETINELAIACAYAGMHVVDPLTAMAAVARGFQAVFPLREVEVEVLFSLITARLMITVASAARNKQLEPDNEYLSISEQPAWNLLHKLYRLPRQEALLTFRAACGWDPAPDYAAFVAWASQRKKEDVFQAVIDLTNLEISQLDCSVGSLSLGNNLNWSNSDNFSATINRMIREGGGVVGGGGYGETRPFYTTDAFQSEGNEGPRWRTTHLGYDIWTLAGTKVSTPLKGSVHSFQYDPASGSYGATIILVHKAPDFTFYTLYGHLSKESLKGLKVGAEFAAGQKIATLGDWAENGGWPPHLHFQVMLDTLEWQGDFPGVAYPETALAWLSNSPDPRWLMPADVAEKLGFVPSGADDLSDAEKIEQLLADRINVLGQSLSVSYAAPLHIVRGSGQYLYDTTGRRYLDTVNNVAHVGHEHPEVVKAGQQQMAVLNTNSRYLHHNITEFARELLATFPPDLCVVHFVNSGSEANELALRMAEAHSGCRNVIAVEAGYHGNTGRAIDVSSYKFDRKGGRGAPSTTQIVPLPDVFRGLYRDVATAGAAYAAHLDEAIAHFEQQSEPVGAFICESVLSCGGQIELPENYLRSSYEKIRAVGGLCIADEVQVGLGRLGSNWWGFELQGVIPDIVTIGKPLGNGHPLAAVVCTRSVANTFANGMEYFNTFGGNPVSCSIGSAVLQAVQTEGLMEHAQQMGQLLKTGFKHLQTRHPVIGDVRGQGLFLGIELMQDNKPATENAKAIKNQMRRFGILMSTDGPDDNVLKIKPPLCFDATNAALLLDYFERCLQQF